MKKKALYAYAALLLIVFPAHAFALRFPLYLIPVYLVAVPLALGRKIDMGLSARQAALTVIISAVVLLPLLLFFLMTKGFVLLGPGALAVQLFGVCFPEEVFFRGFLQETFGNNFRGIVLTSLLFAAAHLPGLLFSGDSYAPLTFFPSLIMGFLYLRTSSVMPPTIFHFLANVVYLGSL
jgi:membrane protease YdiL (CAAX protease family)